MRQMKAQAGVDVDGPPSVDEALRMALDHHGHETVDHDRVEAGSRNRRPM